jgi:hypothetical protein
MARFLIVQIALVSREYGYARMPPARIVGTKKIESLYSQKCNDILMVVPPLLSVVQ